MVVAGVSILAALIMAGVLAGTLVSAWLADGAWTPLGPFPVQEVSGTGTFTSPVPGDNIVYPSVTLADGKVRVTGTKCYKEPVVVEGSVSWSSTDPPGLSLLVGNGTGDRDKGCADSTYENLIPPLVSEWARARFAEGRAYVLVRITGTETAVKKDGHQSVPLTWRTEVFAILPDDSDG